MTSSYPNIMKRLDISLLLLVLLPVLVFARPFAVTDSANAPDDRPYIHPEHFGTPDWKSVHRKTPDGVFPAPATAYDHKKLRLEKLSRGVVAWRAETNVVCVSWRYLSSDPTNQTFNVYKDGKLLGKKPIATVTQVRVPYTGAATYSVEPTLKAKVGGGSWKVPKDAPIGYIRCPLTPPPVEPIPNEKYEMAPGDCSAADVDGDGEMEMIIKWIPTNNRDNSHPGHTGPTWFEAVKFSTGKSLWKINLGRNIRSGEHYVPFVVYDFDGDGCAELIVRTSDGTVDGTGRVLGDPEKKWVERHGAVIFAPLWYTVFDGKTGKALDSITMKPDIGRSWRACREWYWGDHGNLDGNRPFRFLATLAFLDGERPSAVMCRGYYSRTGLMALDWDGKRLKEKWYIDSLEHGEKYGWIAGHGFHNLRAADVDFDGKDEIVYGGVVIDHDGTGKFAVTGHGDALNLFQLNPYTPGLVVWACLETGGHGGILWDAGTGRRIMHILRGKDTPRATAGDIDGCTPGTEMWASTGIGMFDGDLTHRGWPPAGLAFWAYYSGDMTRACVAGHGMFAMCSKTGKQWALQRWEGCGLINGSKCSPNFQGDIFGDWREEIVERTYGDRPLELRMFLSPCKTPYRFWTMLEDPPYRNSVASQNAGYNQPPQPGFYFGPDLLGHGIWFRGTYLPKWK